MSNEIAKTNQTGIAKRDPFVDNLVRDAMAHAASSIAVNSDRLSGALLAAFRKTPKLSECDPYSIISSLQVCVQTGLLPNTPMGHIYLIPYGKTCTPMLGYKGYHEMARRHPSVRVVFTELVFTGDVFDLASGSDGVRVEHKPDPTRSTTDADWRATRDRLVGAYSVCVLDNGERLTRWISTADIEARRLRGASGNGKKTPWDTDYAAMARKSAVRALFGSGEAPMSDEIAAALEVDDTYDRAEIVAAQASTGPGVASVGYDTLPGAVQIEAVEPLPPKVEAMRARLESNGWLPDAVAKFGEPAAWDLADVIAWGKARKAEIDEAAAKVAAFGESGGEE